MKNIKMLVDGVTCPRLPAEATAISPMFYTQSAKYQYDLDAEKQREAQRRQKGIEIDRQFRAEHFPERRMTLAECISRRMVHIRTGTIKCKPEMTKKTPKTTLQIATETMDRIRMNNRTDNAINHISRYISDTIIHNGNVMDDHVRDKIGTPMIYLAIAIVKSRLKQIQLRHNNTYSEYNWNVINALSELYDTSKINMYDLYFGELNSPVRADRIGDNALYRQSNYSAYSICADMISECVCIIYSAINDMIANNQPVNLLDPYIIPYDTTDTNGVEKSRRKWKYKCINVIRSAADSVEKIFSEYRSTVLIDDVLTDSTGTIKCLPLSAVSDTVADVIINDELILLFDEWIIKYNISDYDAKIIKMHFLHKMTVEMIADKIGIEPKSIEQAITRAKKRIASSINNDFPDTIAAVTAGKKMIVLYNAFGDRVCMYPSVSACARALNVSRTAIQRALKFPRISTCRGYTMDYIRI